MILSYNGKRPVIGKHVYIAPTAAIIGDVTIEDHASIWYGAVIRGDLAPITIGRNTNVQDNCTLHVDKGQPVRIGDNVTIGHNAVVHGCTLEAWSLIGINAVVLNAAVVRTGSIVAAGSVVRERQIVGPHHLVAGIPAALKKELSPDVAARLTSAVEDYLILGREHAKI